MPVQRDTLNSKTGANLNSFVIRSNISIGKLYSLLFDAVFGQLLISLGNKTLNCLYWNNRKPLTTIFRRATTEL